MKAKQPPSGGCVLKQELVHARINAVLQPPSGGCVLKQDVDIGDKLIGDDSRLRAAVC